MAPPDGQQVEPSAVRPFVERRVVGVPATVADGAGDTAGGVRAYAMTGGRARTTVQLEFETMLQATVPGRTAATSLRFERSRILEMAASTPVSVAELSAQMGVPLGVVRVLAADLLADGYLESFQPSANVADDVLLITRLIAGVRAL